MKSLQIMDFSFIKLGELAQYESIQMTRSYYGTGSVSITVDPRAKNALLLQPDVIVFFSDTPARAFLIEDIASYARTRITFTGCMLKGLARRRVCVPPVASGSRAYQDFGWDRFTGDTESAYLHFAANNLVSPGDAARAIPNMALAENQNRGDTLPWQARFDRLDTLLQTIGETTEMGWDIRPELAHGQFVFGAWAGLDRTQGAPLCLISEENGNAADIVFQDVRSGSSTTAYVGGAGEDEERFILAEGGGTQGIARRELWTEAGSIDEATLLKLYAQNKLTDTKKKTTLTATLIDSGACRYGRDYDVGDKVLISGRGATTAARITEITETHEKGCRQLRATFGDTPVTVGKLLTSRQTAAR